MKTVSCRDIKGNRQDVNVDELSYRPSVYGVAIKDDQVLLVPQWDGYDIPGGGMDLGETIEKALIREFKEETGLDVEMGEILLVENDFFTHPYSKKHLQTILIYFSCEVTGGEVSTEGFDINEQDYAAKAEWVSLDKVPELKFYNPIDSLALIDKARRLMK